MVFVFQYFLDFYFVLYCVCVCVCSYTFVCRYPWMPEQYIGHIGVGVAGGCEQLSMETRKQTAVIWKGALDHWTTSSVPDLCIVLTKGEE